MKKLFALLIATVLLLSPITCFAGDDFDADNSVPFSPAATSASSTKVSSLYKLNIGKLSDDTVSSMAVSGNILAILSTEQIGYDTFSNSLSLYDLQKNTVIGTKSMNEYDCTVLAFDGDTLQVRDEFSSKCVKYDKSLKYLGKGKYSYTSTASKAKKNKLIDTNSAMLNADYAVHSNDSYYAGVVFYNDSKNVYVRKNNVSYAGSYKKNILESNNSGKNLEVSVNDYSSGKTVASATFGKATTHSINNIGSIVTKNYAYVAIETAGATAIYRWNYTKDSKPKSFGVTKYAANKIDSKISSQAKKVSKDYKINLMVSPKEDKGIGYGYSSKIKPLVKIVSFLDLVSCIKKYPKSVYKRTYDFSGTKFKNKGYKKLNIYLVGKIKSDFAAAYVTTAHSQIYMIVRPDTCTLTTFSHEFMHVMDYRICAADRKTKTNWEKLNPKKFRYTYDFGTYFDYYSKHKKFRPYFAAPYGMCDPDEDRATVFESFVSSYKVNEKKPDWLKNKPLKKKTKTLINQIEKQYPDIKKKAPWKKYSAYKTLKK